MKKTFVAAAALISLTAATSLYAAPNWLVTPGEAEQAAQTAADAHCVRGNWPDRARACAVPARIYSSKFQPQATERLLEIRDARLASTTSPAAGRIRIYDASAEAAPVALAPTVERETVPSSMQVSYTVPDERLPVAAAPLADAGRTGELTMRQGHFRQSKPARGQSMKFAQRTAPIMRVYGVAF